MGISPSTEGAQSSSPEDLSTLLATRFATKCFTPLELTHFKDTFYSRASDQPGFSARYWTEQTLSDSLGIPDTSDARAPPCALDAGPVLFRMVSYLGAFPFQNSLAPSVLTFEAMVKVVVLLTERYEGVLRRGASDRVRLLFGSLADVGRRDGDVGDTADAGAGAGAGANEGEGEGEGEEGKDGKSHAPGFDVDEPANDDYEEDDDDLALAALESLDAIEVFKHDSRMDKAVYEARVSIDTFRRLLMLLLVIAPLKPLESVETYTSDLSEERMKGVRREAENILSAFKQEPSGGISYRTFAQTVSTSLPFLFDPLTPLFEHLLFSKNLDLTQRRDRAGSLAAEPEPQPEPEPVAERPEPPPSITLPGSFESAILDQSMVSHLSFFLPSTSSNTNLLRGNVRLHPVFSTAAHGSSLTSFHHNVVTWQSSTLLLLEGSTSSGTDITLGAYLPEPWKSPHSHPSTPKPAATLPCLFQLAPEHILLPGNPASSVRSQTNVPPAYFSTHTGIAIGCQIPPSSRTQHLHPTPSGGASLTLDSSLETATLYISPVGGQSGVFLPPLPPSSSSPSSTTSSNSTKTRVNIYTLEIWGMVPGPPDDGTEPGKEKSAVEIQQAKWDFEAREAERRRNVNLKAGAGDSAQESARWLLEAAGVIGGEGRSGGSV